jgi:hypothetical protein
VAWTNSEKAAEATRRGAQQAAELKSMEETERRRELQAEISAIDARREFALKVLEFLHAPNRPVTGVYGPQGG